MTSGFALEMRRACGVASAVSDGHLLVGDGGDAVLGELAHHAVVLGLPPRVVLGDDREAFRARDAAGEVGLEHAFVARAERRAEQAAVRLHRDLVVGRPPDGVRHPVLEHDLAVGQDLVAAPAGGEHEDLVVVDRLLDGGNAHLGGAAGVFLDPLDHAAVDAARLVDLLPDRLRSGGHADADGGAARAGERDHEPDLDGGVRHSGRLGGGGGAGHQGERAPQRGEGALSRVCPHRESPASSGVVARARRSALPGSRTVCTSRPAGSPSMARGTRNLGRQPTSRAKDSPSGRVPGRWFHSPRITVNNLLSTTAPPESGPDSGAKRHPRVVTSEA